ATAADANRNCASAAPASANVAPTGGGTVTQNFTMTGASKLEGNGFTIDDSTGNGNGIVNRAECIGLNLGIKNNGCAKETAISANLTTSDSTQQDRIGRDSFPSTCSGKASPGGGFAGTHYYKTYNFTNTSGAARCYTVTINAALGGPGDIESVAYDQTYDPTMIDTN